MNHLSVNEALIGYNKEYIPDPTGKTLGTTVNTPFPPGVYCCIDIAGEYYKDGYKTRVGQLRDKYKILFECRARNVHHMHKERSNRMHFFLFEIPETKESV